MLFIQIQHVGLEPAHLLLQLFHFIGSPGHFIIGTLFPVLCTNIGFPQNFFCFLLGFLEDALPHPLGIDHGQLEGFLLIPVILDFGGQDLKFFLIISPLLVHSVQLLAKACRLPLSRLKFPGGLFQQVVYILRLIAPEHHFKLGVTDIIGCDHTAHSSLVNIENTLRKFCPSGSFPLCFQDGTDLFPAL